MLVPKTQVGNQVDVEQYRCGPVHCWRVGAKHAVLYFPLTGVNTLVTSQLAAAISSWTSFLPLHQVIHRFISTVTDMHPSEIGKLINSLYDSHCLVPLSQIGLCPGHDHSTRCSRIEWLVVPTFGRTALVNRSLRSYAQHLSRFGYTCGILISDDCRSPQRCRKSREMLREFAVSSGIRVWYAGVDQKAHFVRCLENPCDLPPDILQYLFWGAPYPNGETTIGANRNTVLCHTLGSLLLSVDDDTLCCAGSVPGSKAMLNFGGHLNPTETWCFPNRSAAVSFCPEKPIDVLGEHQSCLGQPLSRLLSKATMTGTLGNADALCCHVIRSLLAGHGRVRITYNGARGDGGLHSDLWLLAQSPPATKERLEALGDKYVNVLEAREIVRQAICQTVVHADCVGIGMCMGLDNREILPPFMPNGRNEDGVFSYILGRASDNNYAVHLPFTLIHDPPTTRSYSPDRDVVTRMADVIISCLAMWHAPPGSDPTARIRGMGDHLAGIGSAPSRDFEEIICSAMCSRLSSIVYHLEHALASTSSCSHLRCDLENRLNSIRQTGNERGFFWPVDAPGCDSVPVAERVRETVKQFGRLLQWWPSVLEKVATLRAKEVTIGECLN